ncbi:MAG TPA: hypothetical protein ENF78_05205 [Candidatus Bathyarchaeota archaeon]|nr:hypothetical protein [Candidatus Bathyarchaeota archaeon]
MLNMLRRRKRDKPHVFYDERTLRVKRIKTASGREYYDFLVSLPRPWVQRLIRELGVRTPEELKEKIKLVIIYDGDIIIKPA